MGYLWRLIEWLGLAAGFVAAAMALFFFAVRRRFVRRMAGDGAERGPILATGARVAANGEDTGLHHPEVPGMLMLLASGLYFHSWLGEREVFVPGPSISWIGVTETTGQRTDRHRIVVRFLNAEGKEDGIAIRLLFTEQWVEAIKSNLITRVS